MRRVRRILRALWDLATLPWANLPDPLRVLVLCAFALAGCPVQPAQIEACQKACAPRPMVFVNALKCDCGEVAPRDKPQPGAAPCSTRTMCSVWDDCTYGGDPVTGVCWIWVANGAVPVPCVRVLHRPEFAAVRDCPAFRPDGGTR